MRSDNPHPALVFGVIFVFIFLLHLPLLQLPYFWDEAGYYIPAARDILLSGSLIPRSTVSNAHPPLVMAWLALWWKAVGYDPLVTRSAMLVIAALSLTGVFRLAQRAANTPVAIASTLCTAVYPVFFAQSSLAHVDLAAAGLVCWGLWAYLDGRPVAVALCFSLAALAKETAILAPAILVMWELLRRFVPENILCPEADDVGTAALSLALERSSPATRRRILALLFPLLPLVAWYCYHYVRTGYVFGNPEFFRYNVTANLSPIRFLLALALRLWQALGYLHLWALTLGALFAMLLPPVKDSDHAIEERPRIAIPIQLMFLAVAAAYVVALALVGGAVLARYMLPVIPLVIIVCVSTLRRRLRAWLIAIAVVILAFVAAWFWNPPYGFAPEDNLAYRDYIRLHEDGERFLEARYPMARALTAWPASDELSRPWLGYVTRPVQVVRIEDFSLDEVLSAADFRSHFDVALVFSTKYEPPHPLIDSRKNDRWKRWEEMKARFFGFHRDLPPALIARILGGHIVFSESRQGQWVAVIEVARDEMREARLQKGETPSGKQ